MNKKSTSKTFDDEAPITQSDIKSSKPVLRKRATAGVILSNKQRVNIYWDATMKTIRKELSTRQISIKL